jgi:hypothetical protein
MTTRLTLPTRRVFDDAAPLLRWPRFAIQIRPKIVARERLPARSVLAEFLVPARIQKDVLTVRCAVDGVQFELAREGDALTPIVVHMEKPLGDVKEAMQVLPSFARAMLVFDHRARNGVPEAVAMVGLIDWFAPRAGMEKLGETNSVVWEADHAMQDVFGAVARWMEQGHG